VEHCPDVELLFAHVTARARIVSLDTITGFS